MKWRWSLRAGLPGAVVVLLTSGEEVGELWPCGARGLRVRVRTGSRDSDSGVRGVGDSLRGQGSSGAPCVRSGCLVLDALRSGLCAVVSSSVGALP
ncbi:hypothetical protein NPIL_120621 [Nephila pilipes]|uniref:Secreted protein n=1 Tax=Nephila pilipes TaxID=299642 RepID=A0A8X6MPA8_NEPPI|nr:hypothetical protein NPIL_120621 [Nephila pilipes]